MRIVVAKPALVREMGGRAVSCRFAAFNMTGGRPSKGPLEIRFLSQELPSPAPASSFGRSADPRDPGRTPRNTTVAFALWQRVLLRGRSRLRIARTEECRLKQKEWRLTRYRTSDIDAGTGRKNTSNTRTLVLISDQERL